MKTHQEAWEALTAGHVLVDSRDGQEVKLIDGNVMDVRRMVVTTIPFICKEHWSIKPTKLPFVEALRSLAAGECSEIRRGDRSASFSSLGNLVSGGVYFVVCKADIDAEWELVK